MFWSPLARRLEVSPNRRSAFLFIYLSMCVYIYLSIYLYIYILITSSTTVATRFAISRSLSTGSRI